MLGFKDPRLLFAILASSSFAALAPAATAADIIVEPDWLRRPTPEQLLAVWPKGGSHKEGKGLVSCKVSAQGALYDCWVVSEEPKASGFGDAALALTPQFLMKPATRNGVPYGGETVRIPINFEQPQGYRSPGPVLTIPILTNVLWTAAPTYAQATAAFPPKARAAGVGGRATLNCGFKSGGLLGGCDVLTQTPTGLGFGAAARSLAPLFVGPATYGPDKKSTKGVRTQIAVTFPVEMIGAGKPVIGKPQWTGLPTGEALQNAIPATVAPDVTIARVTLACVVGAAGEMQTYRVESETPPGQGMGEATLGLSKTFRLSLWTAEGLPTIGGEVKIPIRYDITPLAPKPAAKP